MAFTLKNQVIFSLDGVEKVGIVVGHLLVPSLMFLVWLGYMPRAQILMVVGNTTFVVDS